MCVEQFIEQLVEQAEKLTSNGNASPVGQESSAAADESGENMHSASDKGMLVWIVYYMTTCVMDIHKHTRIHTHRRTYEYCYFIYKYGCV